MSLTVLSAVLALAAGLGLHHLRQARDQQHLTPFAAAPLVVALTAAGGLCTLSLITHLT